MNADCFLHAFSAAEIARRRLGFEPDAKQSLVLGKRVRRGLLNCSRQWGKSTVAAAKAVHQAEMTPGSLVVLGPVSRQSGELLRKARSLCSVWVSSQGAMGTTRGRCYFRMGRGLWDCRGRRGRCAVSRRCR